MSTVLVFRVINMCKIPVIKWQLDDVFKIMYKATRRKIAAKWRTWGYADRGGSYRLEYSDNMEGHRFGYKIIVSGPPDLLAEIKAEFDLEIKDLYEKPNAVTKKIRSLLAKFRRSAPQPPMLMGKVYDFWVMIGWHMSVGIEEAKE